MFTHSEQNTKQRGNRAERLIDSFMKKVGWDVHIANFNFRGGELDRVYRYLSAAGGWNYCCAEIKSSVVSSKEELGVLDSENFWLRFLKKKQLRNLLRAKHTLSLHHQRNQMNCEVYLRLFLVLWSRQHDLSDVASQQVRGPGKLCAFRNEFLIYSVEPEFIESSARSSLLQIRL